MTGLAGRKSFGSDNHAGTHPAVMRAIVEANTGDAVAYGADPWTARAVGELRRLAGGGRRGVPGAQRQRRERARARPAARPARGGHLRGVRAHQHRRVRCRRADTRHQAADGSRAGRQAHARTDRQPPCRPRRRALRPAGRRRHHPVDRGRHLLLARGAARDQRVLRGQRTAGLHGRRPAGQRRRVPGLHARRASRAARTCSASAARRTARWASRRSSSCGPAMPPTRRTCASSTCSSRPRCASSAAQFIALLDRRPVAAERAHANAMASRLAAGLADMPGVDVVYPVEADAVFARLDPPACRRIAARVDVPRLGRDARRSSAG